jgi:hypothetical protein
MSKNLLPAQSQEVLLRWTNNFVTNPTDLNDLLIYLNTAQRALFEATANGTAHNAENILRGSSLIGTLIIALSPNHEGERLYS